jgi:hypothetical protein
VGGIWRNGQPYTRPIEGNETVQSGNNTMVNYGAPNSENLDDFMRLDASFSYSFNFTAAIKATYAVESSISLMKTMSSTAITK